MDKNNGMYFIYINQEFLESLIGYHYWRVWRIRTWAYLNKYYMLRIILGQAFHLCQTLDKDCFSLSAKILCKSCKGMFTCNDMNPKINKMEKVKTQRRAFLKFFFSREIVKQQKTFEEYFDKENYLKWKSIIFVLRTAELSIFL